MSPATTMRSVFCHDVGGDLHRVLAAACEPVPAWDPVVYLADFGHQMLFPLAADAAEQEMAGTMAGRAFTTGQPVISQRGRLGPGVGSGGGADDQHRGAGVFLARGEDERPAHGSSRSQGGGRPAGPGILADPMAFRAERIMPRLCRPRARAARELAAAASGAAGLPETQDGAGYPVRDPLPDKPGSSSTAGLGVGSYPPARSSPEKVRDIVGLHMDPPEKALVPCVDEKSQIQALDRLDGHLICGNYGHA